MKKTSAFSLFFLPLILLTSCVEEEIIDPVSVSIITEDNTVVYINDSLQLETEVLDEDATNKELLYTVLSGDSVSVSDTGLVKGLQKGESTIRVTSKAVSTLTDEVVIVVKDKPVITIGEVNTLLKIYDVAKIEASISHALTNQITFNVISGSAVAVSVEGYVVGMETGEATVRVGYKFDEAIYEDIAFYVASNEPTSWNNDTSQLMLYYFGEELPFFDFGAYFTSWSDSDNTMTIDSIFSTDIDLNDLLDMYLEDFTMAGGNWGMQGYYELYTIHKPLKSNANIELVVDLYYGRFLPNHESNSKYLQLNVYMMDLTYPTEQMNVLFNDLMQTKNRISVPGIPREYYSFMAITYANNQNAQLIAIDLYDVSEENLNLYLSSLIDSGFVYDASSELYRLRNVNIIEGLPYDLALQVTIDEYGVGLSYVPLLSLGDVTIDVFPKGEIERYFENIVIAAPVGVSTYKVSDKMAEYGCYLLYLYETTFDQIQTIIDQYVALGWENTSNSRETSIFHSPSNVTIFLNFLESSSQIQMTFQFAPISSTDWNEIIAIAEQATQFDLSLLPTPSKEDVGSYLFLPLEGYLPHSICLYGANKEYVATYKELLIGAGFENYKSDSVTEYFYSPDNKYRIELFHNGYDGVNVDLIAL